MYIYAETNRSRNADGLVICALPCQRKDMSGPHLSSQRPYIACHTGQTNKKGKDCTQMPRFKKEICHLACLPVFWVVAYHESKEPFNKSLQKYPVKFSVKRQLRMLEIHCKNMMTMFPVLLNYILMPAFFTTYNCFSY